MTLHTQDWINLSISLGTMLAAGGSWYAANNAVKIADKAQKQSDDLAKTEISNQNRIDSEEQARWLSNILFSLAEQCNQRLNVNGVFLHENSDISRISTVTHNAIDLIFKYRPNDKDRFLDIYWMFLHSSVWIEFKERNLLKAKKSYTDLSAKDKEILNTIEKQYDYVEKNIILPLNK